MAYKLEGYNTEVAYQSTITTSKNLNVGGTVTVASAVATTAGGAVAVAIGSSSAPDICFGSGAPTMTAPQGSLYLRTDGSSTSTRMYVNTDSGTTWTAVTTAA